MGNQMVKEYTLIQMVESMLGNSRMGNIMVKEHTFPLMETCMLENLVMEN